MTTALEIVKGALCAVVGFPVGKSTVGSRISEGNKARITVVRNYYLDSTGFTYFYLIDRVDTLFSK